MEKDKKHEVIFEKHNIPDARHIKFVAPEHHQSSTSSGMSSFPLIGLLLGVVIAGSVLGLYFMEMNKQSTSYQNQNQTVLPTQYPQVTSNPVYTQVNQNDKINTATESLYANTKFNYSFKYPKGYLPYIGAGSTKALGDEYTLRVDYDPEETLSSPIFYVTVLGKGMAYNNDSFIENLDKYLKAGVGEVVAPPNQPFQEKFVRQPDSKIDGKIAKVYQGIPGSSQITPAQDSWIDRRLVVNFDNNTYILGGYYIENHKTWDLYQQIISTFKFTN